jgi:hypothetical protein
LEVLEEISIALLPNILYIITGQCHYFLIELIRHFGYNVTHFGNNGLTISLEIYIVKQRQYAKGDKQAWH